MTKLTQKCYVAALFLLILGIQSGLAQTTPSFEFEFDTASITAPPSEFEPIVYNHIINNTNASINIRWRRTILCLGDENSTQICDLNVCHSIQVSTQKFTLGALDTGEISVHLINPNFVNSYMVVRLDFWDIDIPSPDTTRTYWLVNACTSNTDEPLPAAQVSLYPNPVADIFTLKYDDHVANIDLYDLQGRLVWRTRHQPGQSYPVSEVPAGMYSAVLQDQYGRVFQAISVEVRH
jgi:Secretion system C-terminal sorting domain